MDEDHIIGHYRIDSVNRPNCPGNKFPWNRLFDDLAKDYLFHWAEKYIDKCISHGFLSGYPDGTFYPENPLKRGENARILSFIIDKFIYLERKIKELEGKLNG
ncbi:MAG TPA: S-layer homology domain-containing protein [Thermoanaerobacterales bacterium]|nr:S-layer homology domain-containing protein [Thermoanaerobacterales bacterium]